MICVDNSEWMRNGDYSPSRFQAQADAVNLICGAKTQVFYFIFPSFNFYFYFFVDFWILLFLRLVQKFIFVI